MTREPNESLLQNRLTKSRNARVRSYLLIYTRFFLRCGRLKVLTFTVCRMEEEKYGARNEWGWKKVGIRDVGNDAKALIALSSVFRGSTTTIGTKEAGEGGEGFADGWSTWRLGSRRSFLSQPKHAYVYIYVWSRCKEKELRETNKTCSFSTNFPFHFSFSLSFFFETEKLRFLSYLIKIYYIGYYSIQSHSFSE